MKLREKQQNPKSDHGQQLAIASLTAACAPCFVTNSVNIHSKLTESISRPESSTQLILVKKYSMLQTQEQTQQRHWQRLSSGQT